MPKAMEVRKARDLGRNDNKGSAKLIWRVCSACREGKWIQLRNFVGRCRNCFLRSRRGDKNPLWKGGRNREGFGYVSIQLLPTDKYYKMAKKNGYAMEHRVIMARHLNRCLDKKEIVHHLNGIRDDNRIENLALVDRRTHPHRTIAELQKERIIKLEQQLKELK